MLKGQWVPNSVDHCRSHFPTKDLDGGDCLQPIKMWIWCLAAPWPFCPLISGDLALSGRGRQSSSDWAVRQPASFGSVYSQPSCSHSVGWYLGSKHCFSKSLCDALQHNRKNIIEAALKQIPSSTALQSCDFPQKMTSLDLTVPLWKVITTLFSQGRERF